MSTRQRLLDRLRVTPGEAAGLAGRDPSWSGGERVPRARRRGGRAAGEGRDHAGQPRSSPRRRSCCGRATATRCSIVLQAMDAAGKDSVIKHVMSGVNPQGVQVVSFRKPSAEELDHDFLWRISSALPERGRIGIFNRSHYEEVVALKVHPEWLEPQRLPPGERDEAFWQERYDDINAFERHLDAQRDEGRQVLPARLQGGAEGALPRTARPARQGVEVQRRRRRRAARASTSTSARSRTRSPRRRRRGRRGTSSPPTSGG